MVKVVAATSPILLAATMVAGMAAQGQTPAATGASGAEGRQVTVVGCVARNGDVDIDKGTRTLPIGPGALALTGAKLLTEGRSSGVPGTPPQDHDSGTIPRATIVDGRSSEPATTSFALTGSRVSGLGEFVGQRVEVVGRLAAPSAATAAPDQPRGTTGATQGRSAVASGGTREERPGESSAHPSAELRKLDVVSFRGVTGGCD